MTTVYREELKDKTLMHYAPVRNVDFRSRALHIEQQLYICSVHYSNMVAIFRVCTHRKCRNHLAIVDAENVFGAISKFTLTVLCWQRPYASLADI